MCKHDVRTQKERTCCGRDESQSKSSLAGFIVENPMEMLLPRNSRKVLEIGDHQVTIGFNVQKVNDDWMMTGGTSVTRKTFICFKGLETC